jgi:hypothetical protein
MVRLLFISILCIACQINLLGQQKELEAALKKGKNKDNFYVAYPKNLTLEKYNKWNAKNNKYKIMKTTKEELVIFGNDVDCVTEIYFLPVSEMAEYEKQQYLKNVKTSMTDLLAARKRYPDYVHPLRIDGEYFFNSWKGNEYKNLAMEFLSTFPEYRGYAAFKQEFLWATQGDLTYIKGFIDLFQDYQAVENYVLKITTRYSKYRSNTEWVQTILSYLINHVDISRILNIVIDHTNDYESTLITKYIQYTGTKYFSKKSLDAYFASVETYFQLIKEVNNCTPLIQKRPQIENNLSEMFISHRLGKDGLAAWQTLLSAMPDKRTKILSELRGRFITRVTYHKENLLNNIESAISYANEIKTNLEQYISAQIPDAEGMQLAKQYLNEIQPIIDQYRHDIPQAKAYESQLRADIKVIEGNIFGEYANLTVPPYNIWATKDDMLSINADGVYMNIFFMSRTHSPGFYYLPSENKQFSTLDEAVVFAMQKELRKSTSNCWTCDIRSAEFIRDLYRKYGIKQWYKMR